MKKRLFWVCFALFLAAQPLGAAQTVDRAGNPFIPPAKVERIVSLAPSATQVIVDLGLAERLVAIDTYTLPSADMPEDIVRLDLMTPDIERIAALSPDLVLFSGLMLVDGEDPLSQLTALGISVVYIPTSDSIAGILADNLFIGELLGEAAAAAALNESLTEAIHGLTVQTDTPIRVYFEVDPLLYSFGQGVFLNEMIELLGGQNIFADQTGWLKISEEAVIAAQPEIIFTSNYFADEAVEEILGRTGWESIPAIQSRKVFQVDADSASQPNHRIVIALRQMAEAMGL